MKQYTPKELVKIFRKDGWEIKANGCHIKMTKENINYTVSIPNHEKIVSMPLARRLLKESGVNING